MSEHQTRDRERSIGPVVGPSFFKKDGEVFFQYVIDGGNVVGPRRATKRDKEDHAALYAALEEPKRGPGRPPKGV